MNYLDQPLIFLIEVLFGLYITVVLLRFLFQLVRANFYNPIAQAIVTLTNPPLRILRRVVPGIGKIDTSSLVLATGLQLIATSLINLIAGGAFLPLTLLFLCLVEILNHFFNIYIFSIIILAILSWVSSSHPPNPLASILMQITNPLMRPARRILPPVGMFDLSPVLVIIALFFLKLLIIPPLHDLARIIGI